MSTYLSAEEIRARVDKLRRVLPPKLLDEFLAKASDARLTEEQFKEALRLLVREYYRAVVDPGEAIGVVTAQSVGEPSTQMILRSFHFAGLREFSMALGLPRLIEVIDARKKPERPMMTVYLQESISHDRDKALEVAKQLQSTTVENVAKAVSIDYIASTIIIELNEEQLRYKGISVNDVKKVLDRAKGKGGEIEVNGYTILVKVDTTELSKLKKVRDRILQTKVKGIKGIKKAVVIEEKGEYIIQTEGTNLEAVLLMDGVDHKRTVSNDIHEISEVLGIEAARSAIINEIQKILQSQSLEVDVRHLMMVADVMTWDGVVRQVGRHGVAGMKESPLAKAAFEVTVKNLVEASLRGETERFKGVVENVIAGKYIPIGTGFVELLMEMK
ncbi:MAG: DNA-directed RNA polymerase subunit A'' [Thermocladium sp.]